MSYMNAGLPPIAIPTTDLTRLEMLANAAARTHPAAAEFLMQEITRAQTIAGPQALPGLVTMGAYVVYRDDISEEIRSAILVYPESANISEGKISVLTPVGTALIGLSVGQSIEFRTPAGGHRAITIMSATHS